MGLFSKFSKAALKAAKRAKRIKKGINASGFGSVKKKGKLSGFLSSFRAKKDAAKSGVGSFFKKHPKALLRTKIAGGLGGSALGATGGVLIARRTSRRRKKSRSRR